MLHDVVVVGQFRVTILRLGMRTSSIFNSQQITAGLTMVSKRVQFVAPNNAAICCVQKLRPFGRSLQMLSQQCEDMLIKSRIWEKKEGWYAKPLVKVQVTAFLV